MKKMLFVFLCGFIVMPKGGYAYTDMNYDVFDPDCDLYSDDERQNHYEVNKNNYEEDLQSISNSEPYFNYDLDTIIESLRDEDHRIVIY